MKCWSSCAGTTCGATALRQTLLLSLPNSSTWNLSVGHSQSQGAIPQPHTFGCSPAQHSRPLKIGSLNDAGSRQGEGDGGLLSCSLQRCPSDQSVGTASDCCTNNFPPQSQKEARKKLCPEPSVPGRVFLFILTFILSRVVSQFSGSQEKSQTQP